MDLLVSIFPIVLLIYAMTKKHPVPSYIALPATALLVGIFQVFYFHANQTLLLANAISGVLSTLTPISIIAGAILLNRVMVLSGAENIVRHWLESISTNAVAQLMIIGWAFAFMIEGASGFGTPAAIAAPILVGLGFNPIKVILLTLTMNSVPVSFGAVGTPTWFGFAPLNLKDAEILSISQYTALVHTIAAFFIPIIALRFVVSWQDIRRNIIFILLSVLSCTLPYLLIAQWNYEFPSLLGGVIGLVISVFLARHHIGLSNETRHNEKRKGVSGKALAIAISPMILLVGILIITRIKQLGIKQILTDMTPWLHGSLGSTHVSVTDSLAISLTHIFGTSVSWAYKTLYVPALIPFLVVVLISIPILKMSKGQVFEAFSDCRRRILWPSISLMGALVMVKFMMLGKLDSPVLVIGHSFAELTGDKWTYFASYLGALGAFFSGSATVSNLTFGAIQQSIAVSVGLPQTLILALQSVGGAMGNMVCLNNIIAVSTILGISHKEGFIMKRTVVPMAIYGLIAALVSVFL
ncbi:L-lactate permease [Marinomonas spartinae]|uniref:L-lactate permease n=1 Tax=Marinomonas spartinae TaxID=1792290 RepID=UPI0018F10DD3|nr:L-lactate permease [Marinomonas spartinae]MBJ7555865.1 L-lactate permease [Marinomonas spartinae]